ncbi:MAG TPA: Dam family site-specific DNA-(adenine-N6)-methyltransferase [Methyloceanibacter sp.]|nr:Dam family site-specific DNA-(adenine-N6)-methyltransferase [Methyloceanibacter sp.]
MIEPFLKWVGSKRGQIDQLRPLLPPPEHACGYRQPFLGGGSPFWQHEPGYSADHYHQVRQTVNARRGSLVERAAGFIVINRWGFNGLWRVNQHGLCNVAFGKTSSGNRPLLCDVTTLRACSRALRGVDIRHEGFEATLAGACAGEVVYLDPPYHPTSETADFTAYTPEGFRYRHDPNASLFGEVVSDHERLLGELRRLDARGVAWVLSNADCKATRAAYAAWEIATVTRSGGINCDPTKRGKVGEIVVRGRARS